MVIQSDILFCCAPGGSMVMTQCKLTDSQHEMLSQRTGQPTPQQAVTNLTTADYQPTTNQRLQAGSLTYADPYAAIFYRTYYKYV